MLARQSHSWYAPGNADNPRFDKGYIDRVARCLLEHVGKRVNVQSVIGGDPWVVHESVEYLRWEGHDIEGVRGGSGYKLLANWTRPERWTRREPIVASYEVAALLRLCGYHGPIELRPKRSAPSVADNQTDIPLDTSGSAESDPWPEWWREPEPRRVEPLAGQVAWC